MKQYCRGLTLIEILLSITILTLILSLFIPQLLQYSRDQAVDKTVAEMNQIVLAARNYYQDKQEIAVGGTPNSSNWPQTLQTLVTEGYLPQAALCSTQPSSTTSTLCANHAEYALFPSNAGNRYDTTVVGIAASGFNSGGNFWGVSVSLANAKIAEEVRKKLPFGTRCSIADLRSGAACTVTDANTTVTALTPRPAIFTTAQYSREGLIQTMGSIQVCDGNCTNSGKNMVNIAMPVSCDANQIPVLFVYPFDIVWNMTNNNRGKDPFPGISLKTVRNSGSWTVTASEPTQANKTNNFSAIYLAYFTVCAAQGDPNKWDPSWFSGV